MRTFRLATPEDIPALAQLALDANQIDADLPDLVFLCLQDGEIIAAVGLEIGRPGMVVASGAVIHPSYYRNPFVAFRLQEFMEDWLIEHNCFAYVCGVTKRNTRVQRWLEKLGARRYTKKNGIIWYLRTIGPHRNALQEAAA